MNILKKMCFSIKPGSSDVSQQTFLLICSDSFPCLSTFITEVEGLGWLNGGGVRAVQRHNKACRSWWPRDTQTLPLLHRDRLSPGTVPVLAFSPPSISGFMFAYCSSNSWFQPTCLSLCWAVGEGGEWWAGEAKNLSDFSFLPSTLTIH